MRTRLEIALENFGVPGISVEVGSCRFTDTEATFKVTLVDADGASRKEKDWDEWAEALGLKKEWLGKTIILHGKPFKITGLRPNARKNNICIETPKGKPYVVPHTTVKRQLGGSV